MSRVSNHTPEVIDNFEWQGGFVADRTPQTPVQPVPPRRPRPVTDPPVAHACSTTADLHACESLPAAEASRQPGQVAWYVEYFLRNVKAGRFLGGPYTTRAAAVEYATWLMEHTEYEHEVCRVTVLAFENGGAA